MSINFQIPFIQYGHIELTSLFVGHDQKEKTVELDAFYAAIDTPSWIDRKTIEAVVGATLPFKFISDATKTVLGEGVARFEEFGRVGDSVLHNLLLVVDCPEFEAEYESGEYGVYDLQIPHKDVIEQFIGKGPVRIVKSFRNGFVRVYKKGGVNGHKE